MDEIVKKEEVIQRIIQIEAEAAAIERGVEEKICLKKVEQEKNLLDLKKQLNERAQAKVKTLAERELKEVETEINKYKEQAQKQMAALTEIKNQQADKWVQHLFAEITKE